MLKYRSAIYLAHSNTHGLYLVQISVTYSGHTAEKAVCMNLEQMQAMVYGIQDFDGTINHHYH